VDTPLTGADPELGASVDNPTFDPAWRRAVRWCTDDEARALIAAAATLLAVLSVTIAGFLVHPAAGFAALAAACTAVAVAFGRNDPPTVLAEPLRPEPDPEDAFQVSGY
jgi:hypothetical protein